MYLVSQLLLVRNLTKGTSQAQCCGFKAKLSLSFYLFPNPFLSFIFFHLLQAAYISACAYILPVSASLCVSYL